MQNLVKFHPFILKILSGNKILIKVKGHNSDNHRRILSLIELDLCFMIIYLCMKYESYKAMYSKDKTQKPFFLQRSRAITLTTMKCESNTPMNSKDIALKPFFVHREQDIRTRVMLYIKPPLKMAGELKMF